jgi:hypothetical protein
MTPLQTGFDRPQTAASNILLFKQRTPLIEQESPNSFIPGNAFYEDPLALGVSPFIEQKIRNFRIHNRPFYGGSSALEKPPSVDIEKLLTSLQKDYVFLEPNSSIRAFFQQEPSLLRLLLDAVPHLRKAFGDNRILQIRLQHFEDEIMVKAAVQLPYNFGHDWEQALDSFDEEWWLANCYRSLGILVIDYEIQDDV